VVWATPGVFQKGIMIIADQLTLFYFSIGEEQANSAITAENALLRINFSRKKVAAEALFYLITDKITATENGTSEFTLLPTFISLQEARDVITRNDKPVRMKSLAEWATITEAAFVNILALDETWAMLNGNILSIYPTTTVGDEFKLRGAAEPPDLPAITGPDAYLNNREAMACVYDAAETALGDLNEKIPIKLEKNLAVMLKSIKPPRGPRLENNG